MCVSLCVLCCQDWREQRPRLCWWFRTGCRGGDRWKGFNRILSVLVIVQHSSYSFTTSPWTVPVPPPCKLIHPPMHTHTHTPPPPFSPQPPPLHWSMLHGPFDILFLFNYWLVSGQVAPRSQHAVRVCVSVCVFPHWGCDFCAPNDVVVVHFLCFFKAQEL